MAFSFARNSANSETWNCVDLGHLGDLLGVVAVVRQRVVRVGDADLGIGPVAGLAGELEGDDAGDVALERQHLQVEHQPGVVGVGGRHADRAVEVRQVRIRRVAPRPSGCGARPRGRSPGTGRPWSRSAGPSLLLQAGDLVASPSRAGWPACCSAARRSAVLPPSPNRRSKTIRGWASAGSGVVGDDHERLFW